MFDHIKTFLESIPFLFPFFFNTIGQGETGKSADMNEVSPVGIVAPYAGSSAPTGWLLCYGQALDATVTTAYQGLFNIIGNTFGGTNNTDFQLPDMRGNFPLGKDNMGGSSRNRVTHANADTIGAEEGEETHLLTVGEMPAHTHNVNHGSNAGSAYSDNTTLTQDATSATTSAGGGGAHENMPPYITLNYIIRYQAYT